MKSTSRSVFLLTLTMMISLNAQARGGSTTTATMACYEVNGYNRSGHSADAKFILLVNKDTATNGYGPKDVQIFNMLPSNDDRNQDLVLSGVGNYQYTFKAKNNDQIFVGNKKGAEIMIDRSLIDNPIAWDRVKANSHAYDRSNAVEKAVLYYGMVRGKKEIVSSYRCIPGT